MGYIHMEIYYKNVHDIFNSITAYTQWEKHKISCKSKASRV